MDRTHRFARVAITACAACLALPCTCTIGDEDDGYGTDLPPPCERIGDPDFTWAGAGVIGPEGGAVEQTRPDSPVAGVRVEVAPGAWTECWEVHVEYLSIFDVPDYPDGFVPFERPYPSGAVRVQIGLTTSDRFYAAPDPLPIRISFPMGKITVGPLDIRSAFRLDDAGKEWQVVFPDSLPAGRLTVATDRHDVAWSWGRVDMGEIDMGKYVVPAMENYHGSGTLQAIQSALEEIRQQALREEWEWNCLGMELAEAFADGIQDTTWQQVQDLQASLGCGDCNPLTEAFDQGLKEWWSVRQWDVILGFADLMFPPKKAIEIIAYPLENAIQGWLMDAAVEGLDLPCDYDCYFEKVPFLIYVYEAVYYGSGWVRGLLGYYRTQRMGCPP